MPDVWTWLIVATLPAVALELLLLRRIRHTWLPGGAETVDSGISDEGTMTELERGALAIDEAQHDWSLGSHPAEPAPLGRDEAVLCFAPNGLCTSANLAGQRLLPRPDGENMLGDLLSGGAPAATSLLATVAAHGMLECDEAIVSAPAVALVRLQALALRDRDSNFWGAALFIRPPAGGAELPAAGPSRP